MYSHRVYICITYTGIHTVSVGASPSGHQILQCLLQELLQSGGDASASSEDYHSPDMDTKQILYLTLLRRALGAAPLPHFHGNCTFFRSSSYILAFFPSAPPRNTAHTSIPRWLLSLSRNCNHSDTYKRFDGTNSARFPTWFFHPASAPSSKSLSTSPLGSANPAITELRSHEVYCMNIRYQCH